MSTMRGGRDAQGEWRVMVYCDGATAPFRPKGKIVLGLKIKGREANAIEARPKVERAVAEMAKDVESVVRQMVSRMASAGVGVAFTTA